MLLKTKSSSNPEILSPKEVNKEETLITAQVLNQNVMLTWAIPRDTHNPQR